MKEMSDQLKEAHGRARSRIGDRLFQRGKTKKRENAMKMVKKR